MEERLVETIPFVVAWRVLLTSLSLVLAFLILALVCLF